MLDEEPPVRSERLEAGEVRAGVNETMMQAQAFRVVAGTILRVADRFAVRDVVLDDLAAVRFVGTFRPDDREVRGVQPAHRVVERVEQRVAVRWAGFGDRVVVRQVRLG